MSKVVISPEEFVPGSPMEERAGVKDWKVIYPETGFDPKSLIAGIVEIPPDDHSPLHRHNCEEMYYVLDGEGYVEIEEEEDYAITAGDAVFNEENVRHRVFNTGDDTLRLLVVAGIMLIGLLPEWPTESPYEIFEQ